MGENSPIGVCERKSGELLQHGVFMSVKLNKNQISAIAYIP